MTEQVIIFIQQYVEWGIFSIGCIAVFTLWRMNWHLKKLNRSLSGISGKMHEYFSVIMEEEDVPVLAKEKRENQSVPKEEKEIRSFGNKEQTKEEEAVIQAVLHEYFS